MLRRLEQAKAQPDNAQAIMREGLTRARNYTSGTPATANRPAQPGIRDTIANLARGALYEEFFNSFEPLEKEIETLEGRVVNLGPIDAITYQGLKDSTQQLENQICTVYQSISRAAAPGNVAIARNILGGISQLEFILIDEKIPNYVKHTDIARVLTPADINREFGDKMDAFLATLHAFNENFKRKPCISAFMSYEWISSAPIVHFMTDHLRLAGIDVVIDRDYGVNLGRNIDSMEAQIAQTNKVLVFGSLAYGRKANSDTPSGVKDELPFILVRNDRNNNAVLRILLEGPPNLAFPPRLATMNIVYADCREAKSYFLEMINILERLHDHTLTKDQELREFINNQRALFSQSKPAAQSQLQPIPQAQRPVAQEEAGLAEAVAQEEANALVLQIEASATLAKESSSRARQNAEAADRLLEQMKTNVHETLSVFEKPWQGLVRLAATQANQVVMYTAESERNALIAEKAAADVHRQVRSQAAGLAAVRVASLKLKEASAAQALASTAETNAAQAIEQVARAKAKQEELKTAEMILCEAVKKYIINGGQLNPRTDEIPETLKRPALVLAEIQASVLGEQRVSWSALVNAINEKLKNDLKAERAMETQNEVRLLPAPMPRVTQPEATRPNVTQSEVPRTSVAQRIAEAQRTLDAQHEASKPPVTQSTTPKPSVTQSKAHRSPVAQQEAPKRGVAQQEAPKQGVAQLISEAERKGRK